MTDLITLAEYKAYKGISNPNKDAIYSVLISSVSGLIKGYCGKTFVDHFSSAKTETFNIKDGRDGLVLKETPVNSVVSVLEDGIDISADTYLDQDLDIIYLTRSDEPYFLVGNGSVAVNYTGGYSTAPSDIKLACYELMDYYLQDEHKASKSFSGTTIEYHESAQQWPYHIKALLDNYRDV